MKRADRISALVIIGISVFFMAEAKTFSPLSGLFPRVAILLLGGLSLLLFILTFVHRESGKTFDSASFRHVPSLISLLLMVVWGILIPVIGFLVTSLIFFPLITLYLDRDAPGKKKLSRIAIVEGLAVAFYLFFTRVLYVPFPEGLLL
ncbi:MAG: tripartite tricarboxylate transporter TctB family protein [Spirochaetaceae bacterium]|nr:tripartite tricarboxylate transporter TctB family protein [Spirochaetaceae bacterium]RKX80616.1 MAG: hypothetical protein DRP60_02785 [Spirochaetota bacterium]RKX87419.1 MAG: hypothetical protein DRP70_08520 [Spirochaetota bacterium]RKX96906.1 MAG: hypothetical protein DRZ90_07915 [Spirochaetota bacterium]